MRNRFGFNRCSHILLILGCFYNQLLVAQSGSFGNMFLHNPTEVVIHGQHHFLNGGSGLLPGIVGTNRLDPTAILSFSATAPQPIGANDQAFVDGYVRKYGTGAFMFPIGDNGTFRPIEISGMANSTDHCTAAYFNANPSNAITSNLEGGNYGPLPMGAPFPGNQLGSTLLEVSTVEYWDVNGTAAVVLKLSWNANSNIGALTNGFLGRLTIVGWTGTQWEVIPSTLDVGSLNAGMMGTNNPIIPNNYQVYTLAARCPDVTATIASVIATCAGASNGHAIVVAGGGEGPYSYSWNTSPVQVSDTATNLAAGIYTAVVTDINGCADSTQVTILETPSPTVGIVPNQSVCNGAQTSTLVFSGPINGTTFEWTNDRPDIGLASSGTGNIDPFTAVNLSNQPIVATIHVTPLFQANGITCYGTAVSFQIIVNPTPDAVSTPTSQTICSGASITPISLSGNVNGTTYSWTRDEATTITGIAASGVGDISGTLTNTTFASVLVMFTITPSANGCTGSPITATVLVNPTPDVVTTPNSQTICSGASITPILLSGNVNGTTYSWTRDETTTITGIAANGVGTISGTLTNTTFAPILVTFTITPSANGCLGSPITATVLVNPTPDAVSTPNSQTICSGAGITPILFSGNVNGTTFSWTRDATTTITGIASSGVGDINGTFTNTTFAPILVTFTISPSANGCIGTPITATLLVNPTPDASSTPTKHMSYLLPNS